VHHHKAVHQTLQAHHHTAPAQTASAAAHQHSKYININTATVALVGVVQKVGISDHRIEVIRAY